MFTWYENHLSSQHTFLYFSVFIVCVVIGIYHIRKWRRSKQILEENQPLSDNSQPVYRGF